MLVVVWRRTDWLVGGMAAACLLYGGVAALHAVILVSLGEPSGIPGEYGEYGFRHFEIIPYADDPDVDATFAIAVT